MKVALITIMVTICISKFYFDSMNHYNIIGKLPNSLRDSYKLVNYYNRSKIFIKSVKSTLRNNLWTE